MPGKYIRQLSADDIAALRARMPHDAAALATEIGWLDELDRSPPETPPSRLSVGVFNVERGSRFDSIVELLQTHPELRQVDTLLLNEVDWGMARSDNRHVAREIAAALGMGYVFGTEFLELTKGEHRELEAAGENTWSLHGNAILSRHPLHNPRLLRLPRYCSWAEGSQLRIGGRMALLAEIRWQDVELTVGSVHLENRTTPDGRAAQFDALLAALPERGAAIIGGDLNTATIDGGKDEEIFSLPGLLADEPLRLRRPQAREPLFERARRAGFDVDSANPADVPTSVPMGIEDPTYWLKLDWLFSRDLHVAPTPPPCVVQARHRGERVSDHDCVVAHFAPGS